MSLLRVSASLALLMLPGLAWADDLVNDKVHQGSNDQNSVIYLGVVAVGGKVNVLEALEDIKLALDQPLSDDPKLKDVVVCRITDDIGTHARQLLICGTNETLRKNRELLQTGMSNALSDIDPNKGGDGSGGSSTGCASGSCFQATASILNQSIDAQRHHYLRQQVNGASLHALLAKLPYPKQARAVPAAATVPAPAAITAHV